MCRWNVFVYIDCGCVDESPRLIQQCPFRTGFKHYIVAGIPPGATGAALQRACIETMKISTVYCAGECRRCRCQVGRHGFARRGGRLERAEERDREAALDGNTQARAQLSKVWLETFNTELRAAEGDLQPDIKELLLQFADAERNKMVYEAD